MPVGPFRRLISRGPGVRGDVVREGHINKIYEALETMPAFADLQSPVSIVGTGPLASRPASASEGEAYIAVDGGVSTVYIWSDGAWVNGGTLQGPEGPKGDTGAQGARGEKGDTGDTGPAGDPGEGVPVGGATGQVLAKASGADLDAEWVDPSGDGTQAGETTGNAVAGIVLDNGDGTAKETWLGTKADGGLPDYAISKLNAAGFVIGKRYAHYAPGVSLAPTIGSGNASVTGSTTTGDAYTGTIDPSRTVSCIGDLHFGLYTGADFGRRATFGADIGALRPLRCFSVFMGDLVHDLPAEFPTFLDYADQIAGETWDSVIGNHDSTVVMDLTTIEARRKIGRNGINWIADFDGFRVIGLSPDTLPNNGSATTKTLSPATMRFLDDALRQSSVNTIIACHYGLEGTTLETTVAGKYLSNSADIRTLLAEYRHARAWVHGHNHQIFEISTETLGGRTFPTIESSAVIYTKTDGTHLDVDDPLVSPYISLHDDHLVVHPRDSKTGTWLTDTTVSYPEITPMPSPAQALTLASGATLSIPFSGGWGTVTVRYRASGSDRYAVTSRTVAGAIGSSLSLTDTGAGVTLTATASVAIEQVRLDSAVLTSGQQQALADRIDLRAPLAEV